VYRSWVLLPIGAFALLAAQFSGSPPIEGTAATAGVVDPVALAAATASAGWGCLLPRRARPRQKTVRAPAGLRVSATVSDPGVQPGYVQPIGGLGSGPGQNPRAQITGTLSGPSDVDSFAVGLRSGDVLGVSVQGGAGELQLRDPGNTLVEGSAQDRAVSYPSSSPLPTGGKAVIDHVAAVAGTHVLSVLGGNGPYTATVAIFRPSIQPQRLYLDFRDTTVDTRLFGVDTGAPEPRKLSPLSAFLPRWGLTPAEEPRLIQTIAETVSTNLRGTGAGQVLLETSEDNTENPDHAGTFGQPDVSRVVIGGTQAEAGLNTVGISESVDPGNFAREETALVLLDTLAADASEPTSLNHFIAPGSDRVAFVGRAIGNIASHEAGHFLGSWHTDPRNGTHDLMDSGDLAGAYGYGPDDIGGTADDIRPTFGQDVFAPDEGSIGLENTRARTAVGLGGGSPGAAG
jgi:hypothetical protein